MEGKTRPFYTTMVQHCLHSLLSMAQEMGMQLLLHMWHQQKHRQVRSGCLKIALVHMKCVCTESKIHLTTDSAVMHMATPTMTPMDYTNQGQDISSTISEK